MATPWSQVAQSDEYQALPPDQQATARAQYFQQVVAPQIGNDPDAYQSALTQFSSQFGQTGDASPMGQAAQQEAAQDTQQDQQAAKTQDVGIGTSAIRGVVAGGGQLLGAADALIRGQFDVGASATPENIQQAKLFGVDPVTLADNKAKEREKQDPIYQSVLDAKDYATLKQGESQTFGERVAQGGTSAAVQFAGAMAMTPEVGAEGLFASNTGKLAALARKVIGAAPISASMTAVQDAGQHASTSDVAEDFGANLAMAGLPQAFGKGFLATKLTGGLIGADINLAQQAWHNYWTTKTPSSAQSMPSDHGFDMADITVGGLMGAFLAQSHSSTDANGPYNETLAKAKQGDPDAQATVDLANKVAQAGGMTQDAMDAAQAGQQAQAKVQSASHQVLMSSNDRYRQLYDNATKSGFADDQAQREAKATLVQEAGDNTAWASYTEATLKTRAQARSSELYKQIASLSGEAVKTLDPDQQLIMNRWIETQRPTAPELHAALQESVKSGEAPKMLQDVYADDFNKDGTFTEQALITDQRQHPESMAVYYPKTPDNLKLFQQAGARPYTLDDRYAILGDPSKVAKLTDAIQATTGQIPVMGVDDDFEQLHTQGADQGAAGPNDQGITDQGDGQGNATGQKDQSGNQGHDQAGKDEQAGGNDQGEEARVVTPRSQYVADALEDVAGVGVGAQGTVTIPEHATPEAAQAAMDAAAHDTAATNTDFAEPTPAQAAAGNYRKGGVVFKSPQGDVKVRIENPEGSVRRGPWGSRPLKDAHYGYIPGTKGADGDPLDVLLTRQAHDPNRKVAVISQHDPQTGKFDELKVVMGAKGRGDAMATYLKQYPKDLHDKLLPQGKSNVVMMDRGKFTKFLGTGDVDVPPHPISGKPMLQLRRPEGLFNIPPGHDLNERVEGPPPKLNDEQMKLLSKKPFEPGEALHPWTPVHDDVSIPLTGGVSDDGRSIYLDKRLPPTVNVGRKSIDVHEAVGLHERTEWPLMHLTGPMDKAALDDLAVRTGGKTSKDLPFKVVAKLSRGKSLEYADAHALATKAENKLIRDKYDVDPDAYQKSLTEAIDAARKQAPHEADVPSDLDAKPYTDEGDGHLLEGKTDADLKKDARFNFNQPKTPGEKLERYTGVKAGSDGEIVNREAFDKAVKHYSDLPDTNGGQIISTDTARELSPEYLKDRTKSADVHEAASSFVKALYKQRLEEPSPAGKDHTVLFMAGGTGAGKTTALNDHSDVHNADIIYDSNMNGMRAAISKIDQALASGRDVKIAYVYRDPGQAMRHGALPRAERQATEFGTGRTVPVEEHIKTHVGAMDTMHSLQDYYKDNPDVNIYAYDNSFGKGNSKDVDLEDIPRLNYADVERESISQVEKAYDNGEISPETYRGFLGKEAPVRPESGSGESQASGGIQEGTSKLERGVKKLNQERLESKREEGSADAVREAGARSGEPEVRSTEAAAEGESDQARAERAAQAVSDREAFHEKVVGHIAKIGKQWLGDYPVQVLRHPGEIADDRLRQYVKDTVPSDVTPAALFHNGKVLVFSEAHNDLASVERAVAHEMVGHLGVRGLFNGQGEQAFADFLDDVHGSIKDSDLYKGIEDSYRGAYSHLNPDQFRRAATEEYIAHLAESKAEPSMWKKIVAKVRAIARSMGLVSKWTDDDLYHMLGNVAKDLRNGRIGLGGRESAETRFDNDGKAASTYDGAAGRGYVNHYDDGSRDLDVDGLKATMQTVSLGDRKGIAVGDIEYAEPKDLLKLTRFAGEEGQDVVAIGKGDVTKADLDASGIPYTERMGYYELQASKVPHGPMYALRNRASGGKDIDDLVDKTVDYSDLNMTPWDRFQRAVRNIRDGLSSGDSIMHLKAGYVDAGAPFERTERALNGGLLLDAAESPYKMFWMSKNNEQITAGVLKVGVPKYNNGSFETVAGRQGLVDIFRPLYNTPDGKAIDHLWEAYAYAKRANELIRQVNPDGTSREKLLTQPEIDKLLSLEQKYPAFKDIFDKYQTFNKQLLDLAVDRGAMSPDTADLWKQNMYVPFYRHQEETENNKWQFSTRGISNKKVTTKRLWGSDKKVDPVIDNIVRNTGSILDKIYSNEAMRRVAAMGESTGVMERVKHSIDNVEISMRDMEKTLMKMGFYVGQKQGPGKYSKMVSQADLDRVASFIKMSRPIGHDIVTVYQQGKPVFYRVNDEAWYKSITSFDQIGTFDKLFNTVFGGPKKLLTMATIYNPGFMFRTFIRDAITAWMQTGTNPNMMKHAFANAKDVYTDSAFQNSLRAAGFNGNAYFNAHEMREHMEELHGKNGWTLLSTPKKMWHAYHKIGMMAEQINRLSVAKHVIERGGSVAEAAWQGQNILNFKMRGSNKAMQLLIRTVPFLNARIQGLNRLYLGMTGRDVTDNRSKAVASYVVKAMSVMGASLALQLNNENDPRYQRIPEEDKDLYYHLFIGNMHYTLPKPFETGAMFSTIPERALRVLQGKDTTRTWVESMQRTILHTLDMDPTPQTVNPLVQDYANKDSLTGRPIVSQQYKSLMPEQQATPFTSPFIKKVAGAMPAVAPDALRSPMRLEHLYQGYTSSVGMWLLQGADALTRNVTKQPVQPTSRYGSSILESVMGPAGVSPADNDSRNKYVQQLYDAQDQADDAYNSLMKLNKEGDVDGVRQIVKDNKTALQYRATLHTLTGEMSDMRKAETAVMQSRSLSADQKRERLDQINATRVKILDKVGPIIDIASDYH